MKIVSTLALAALLFATAAWGDAPIYKWVDSQGVVHYSTEPHNSDAKPLDIVNKGNSIPAPSTAPAAASATPPGRASNPGDAALLQSTPDDSPTCKAARARLTQYLQSDQLYKVDDKGQKQVLSKQDQDNAIDLARAYVRQSCVAGGG